MPWIITLINLKVMKALFAPILVSMLVPGVLMGAGPAFAESDGEAGLTCRFLSDIADERASGMDPDRGDVFGVSRTFRPVSGNEIGYIDEIANEHAPYRDGVLERAGVSPSDYRALIERAVAASVDADLPVECPELRAQWPGREEADEVWSQRLEARQVRSALPIDDPEYLPPYEWMPYGPVGEAVPRLDVVYVSRPVFDETGRIAIAEDRPGWTLFVQNKGQWMAVGIIRRTYY